MTSSNALATIPTQDVYFDDLETTAEVMTDNLGPGAMLRPSELDRITIPPGAVPFWSLPSLTGKAEAVSEFEGVVIAWQNHRVLFLDRNAKKGSTPACYSRDGVNGSHAFDGKCGGACATCPMGIWKIDPKNPKKKTPPQCAQRTSLYVMVKGYSVPLHIDLPRSSVGAWSAFMKKLTKAGIPHWQVVTVFGLQKVENTDNPYCMVTLAAKAADGRLFRFSTAEKIELKKIKTTFGDFLNRKPAPRAETAAPDMTDAEGDLLATTTADIDTDEL